MAAVKHHAGNLLNGELGSQILGTDNRVLTPVLVDIQFAVTIQVLEGIATFGDDGHT